MDESIAVELNFKPDSLECEISPEELALIHAVLPEILQAMLRQTPDEEDE